MDQKPTLERIITIGAQAFLLITVLFLGNRWLGISLVVNGTICLLLLTGVVAALVESVRRLCGDGAVCARRTASDSLP